jgi:ribosome maturation factor RimP
MSTLQTEIEERLAASDPQVEVLLVEIVGGSQLRVFIDHPDGVTLGLCEQVSHRLADLRETYALQVSSPGSQRPLTKPDHFRRFVGRRARVRTREPHPSQREAQPERKSFTGELVGASDEEVTLAAESGVIAIPYAAIHRSHLVEE